MAIVINPDYHCYTCSARFDTKAAAAACEQSHKNDD